jgi:acylphosphatase
VTAGGTGAGTVLHLKVLGRVQGVGFRWWAQQRAIALGLRGWVCNRDDGSVEVAAGGPRGAVEALHDALRRGPPGATVSALQPLGPLGDADDLPLPFAVRRAAPEG